MRQRARSLPVPLSDFAANSVHSKRVPKYLRQPQGHIFVAVHELSCWPAGASVVATAAAASSSTAARHGSSGSGKSTFRSAICATGWSEMMGKTQRHSKRQGKEWRKKKEVAIKTILVTHANSCSASVGKRAAAGSAAGCAFEFEFEFEIEMEMETEIVLAVYLFILYASVYKHMFYYVIFLCSLQRQANRKQFASLSPRPRCSWK